MTTDLVPVADPAGIASLPIEERGVVITPTPIAEFAQWVAATSKQRRRRASDYDPSGPAVYMFADGAGDALYIGCTTDVARRINAHSNKSWWITRSQWGTFETVSSVDAARAIERWLIALLQPEANVQHRTASMILTLPAAARPKDDLAAVDRLIRRYRQFRDEARMPAALSPS